MAKITRVVAELDSEELRQKYYKGLRDKGWPTHKGFMDALIANPDLIPLNPNV